MRKLRSRDPKKLIKGPLGQQGAGLGCEPGHSGSGVCELFPRLHCLTTLTTAQLLLFLGSGVWGDGSSIGPYALGKQGSTLLIWNLLGPHSN